MSISLRAFLHIGKGIGQTLLAQDCLLCQAASGGRLLCAACARDLPTTASACPRCAAPGSCNSECGACIADPPHYDGSCAAFAYTYPVDALIQAFKYGGQLALAGLFAHALFRRAGGSIDADLIMPLPLHRARLAERGFNQAAEIAKVLSRVSGVAMDPRRARRVRDTAAQTALPWRERVSNMRGAFACAGGLDGLRIAVVDDVMTTGATLDEFARTLKNGGAARVDNWVVARTARDV